MRPWLVAARPPTLLAGATPVLVGGGIAIGDGSFRADVFVVTLVAAILLNTAVNFANDASDAHRGVDEPDRIGPPRAVAGGLLSARRVWAGTAVTMGLAAACGIYLAYVSDWVILALGAAAIVAALGYSGGPWPYGHHALGEAFVFLFFGLVAVVGSRYAYDATAPAAAWWLAVPVGLVATGILVANNIRDIDTDHRSGKRTLAVVLGRTGTRGLFAGLLTGALVMAGVLSLTASVPRTVAIALLATPAAVPPIRLVMQRTDGPGLIAALKATVRFHALFGLLLAIGAAI